MQSSEPSEDSLSTRQIKAKQWSKVEKLLLIEQIEKSKINGRIQWKKVIEHFPTRTINQCKTQYNIVLNKSECSMEMFMKKLDIQIRLVAYIQYFGTKWNFIQKYMFPEFTIQKLRYIYRSTLRMKEQISGRLCTILEQSTQSEEDINFLASLNNRFNYFMNLFVRDHSQDPLSNEVMRRLFNQYKIHDIYTQMQRILIQYGAINDEQNQINIDMLDHFLNNQSITSII